MPNQAPLTYWQKTGYRYTDLNSVWQEIKNDLLAAKVTLDPVKGAIIECSKRVVDEQAGHFPIILAVMKRFLPNWREPRKRTSVIFCLEDGFWFAKGKLSYRAPIFAWGKYCYDNQTLLMPDSEFFETDAYKDTLAEIFEHETKFPWEKKKNKVFWRGATSGVMMRTDRWETEPRVLLAKVSQKINDPDKLDAWFGRVVDYGDPEITARPEKAGLVRDFRPLKEFFEHRYLIYIDGMHCAWPMHYLTLASHCAVLKVERPFEQWYYRRLKPWVHYIPVDDKLLHFEELLEWVFAHSQECYEIAENGHQFMKNITLESAEQEFYELLNNILDCQQDETPKNIDIPIAEIGKTGDGPLLAT
ncbi:MAG: hypothetical protein D6719_06530 [Candidatus Dadabacteria bacterium]|nr:MAG: hypothetical protein D6719_06530 [Candidatus Dadabacteria bacterium]